jgi:AcrR family transcriptional regulator
MKDVSTVLPEGTGPPARVPAHIFAAAVDTFVAGRRLDMRSLARRIGVARATLYRRVGNREQLLDQVLWWRARRLLADQVRASADLTGTDRLTAVTGGVLHAIAADRPVRMFLESDPETALRLLTGTRSTVHQGMATALQNLIDLERGRGAFDASLDTPTGLRHRPGQRGLPVLRRDRRPRPRHRPCRHGHRGPAARPGPGEPR